MIIDDYEFYINRFKTNKYESVFFSELPEPLTYSLSCFDGEIKNVKKTQKRMQFLI